MKRLITTFVLLLLCATSSAQIIRGSMFGIERTKREKVALPTGWRGFAEAGVGYNFDHSTVGLDADVAYGYQFNPYLFAGLGAGFFMQKIDGSGKNAGTVPVFATARAYFTRTRVKPFLGIKAGYGISCMETEEIGYFYGGGGWKEYNKIQGLYVAPNIGVEVGRFHVAFSWRINGRKEAYESYDYNTSTDYLYRKTDDYIDYNTLVLQVGFNF